MLKGWPGPARERRLPVPLARFIFHQRRKEDFCTGNGVHRIWYVLCTLVFRHGWGVYLGWLDRNWNNLSSCTLSTASIFIVINEKVISTWIVHRRAMKTPYDKQWCVICQGRNPFIWAAQNWWRDFSWNGVWFYFSSRKSLFAKAHTLSGMKHRQVGLC